MKYISHDVATPIYFVSVINPLLIDMWYKPRVRKVETDKKDALKSRIAPLIMAWIMRIHSWWGQAQDAKDFHGYTQVQKERLHKSLRSLF